MASSDQRGTRRRRTTERLRADLLAAAGEVFARRGYGGASIREIAELASTPQASIYRHYGSKADLFVAAVAEPFDQFVTEYAATFQDLMQSGSDPRALSKAMVTTLYDQLQERHRSVFALIAASREPDAEEPVREAVARLDEFFQTLRRLGVELWEHGAPYAVDRAELWQRLAIGMVVSATVLEEILMPKGPDRPDRETLIAVMTDLLTDGFLD